MEHVHSEIDENTPNILVKLDAERIIFHTDKSGFYSLVESICYENSTIADLNEITGVKIEAEGVEDSEVLLRVWITHYITGE